MSIYIYTPAASFGILNVALCALCNIFKAFHQQTIFLFIILNIVLTKHLEKLVVFFC